jgi:predicted SnoaL-like aldol condensation-catalyzing enzyme
MKKVILSTAILLAIGTSVGLAQNKSVSSVNKTDKQKAEALLKSLETGDVTANAYINPNKYIQHNLNVPNGIEAFLAFKEVTSKAGGKITIARVFQDGDYVFIHNATKLHGDEIGFDVFRFEKGKIVEHWDNLQPSVDKTANGHTMIDGSTKVTDLKKTEANKTLVAEFVDKFLVNGDASVVLNYLKKEGYIQHNPNIGDGITGLQAALKYFAENKIGFRYTKVHRVLGEGNFVLVISEGEMGGVHSSFYDLFRVEDNKIAEHWDTIETIPAKTEWKNQNGKFGF